MVISIISGSQNKVSLSERIVRHMIQRLEGSLPEATIQWLDVRDYDIPLDVQVYKNDGTEPEHLRELVRKFYATDAFILITPEYNGSYTPALKNLLNHFPKFQHKAVAIITGSDGSLGGMRAAQHLQLLVAAHFGILSPYMLIVPQMHIKFEEDGTLNDLGIDRGIGTFITEFLWLARRLVINEPAV